MCLSTHMHSDRHMNRKQTDARTLRTRDTNAQEMESDALCRRLHLSDLLPCVFQRITKYPLLISTLAKQTQHQSEELELERLRLAEARARDLLAHVNHEVRMWENKSFLDCVLKKYELTAFATVLYCTVLCCQLHFTS